MRRSTCSSPGNHGSRSGEIVSEELEQECGGSGLRYSFDIRSGPLTHEVGVDAVTGRVLENSLERAINE